MIFQFTLPATQQIIQRLGYSCKVLYEAQEVSHGSDKLSNSSVHCGGSHPCNLLNALLSREHTLAEISWSRYVISSLKKWHLDGLSFSLWWAKWSKMAWSRERWSSCISEYTITSSRYTMVKERFSSPRQFCIRHWNVAGALQKPYGMHRNSYTPMLPTINAIYWRESSDTLTCQKLLLRSMVEKYRAPTKDSMVSWQLGIGYESFLVWAFRHLKSIQNLKVPSFFHTSMMALH